MAAENYVPVPDGDDVAQFLGQGDDAALVALAGQHVAIVLAMARSYTRGRGFDDAGDPAEDLAAVITTAAARMVSNPDSLREMEANGISQARTVFQGWNLAETLVLNRYRVRAA